MKKPNIVFYFSDQQRADTISESVTPTLLELGKSGANFTNAFTCQPVCGPARACLQTGEYASQNGCFKNGISLNENAVTLAKLLNSADYETAYVGKWHLASDDLKQNYQKTAIPIARRGGYKDYWVAADCLEFTSNGYGGYMYDKENNKVEFKGIRSDALNGFACDYIRQKSGDKPFFLFISQLEPHHQNSTDQYECPVGSAEKFKNHPIPKDLTAFKGNYKSRYADYLACCERLDTNIATLVQCLKDKGEWDNTILIYTSDHGCHFRTRNMEYKRSCHDASLHVPLIINGGKFTKLGDISELISLIDLPNTILSLAGITRPNNFMGVDICDIIEGRVSRQNIYAQISESQLGRCVRTHDFTYSVRAPKSLGVTKACSEIYVEDFLYDNKNDPNQLKNLIKDKDYLAIKEKLKLQLVKNMKDCNEPAPTIITKKIAWYNKIFKHIGNK